MGKLSLINMTLRLVREIFLEDRTLSKLYINDEYFCDVLEDTDRGLYFTQPLKEIEKAKVYGKTAIPRGVYEIVISYSNKFQQLLPLLLNVPEYAGIRIHSGVTPEHTLGCLLPGKLSGKVMVNSRSTFKKLFAKISEAIKKEKVIIFIESKA